MNTGRPDGDARPATTPPRAVPWKIALAYVALATCWIVLSNRSLESLFGSSPLLDRLQLLRLAFVFFTGLLLALAMRYYVRRLLVVQSELAAQERRFRALYEHAPVPHQTLDAARRITEVNHAWCRLLGYTRDEVIGRSFAEFVAAGAPACLTQAAGNGANGCACGTCEIELRRRSGESAAVTADCRYDVAAGVENGGAHCVLHDVTEEKRAAREIERLNRLYTVLSQVNQTIVRARSREEVFERVCRAAVVHGRFSVAWIGWLDPETRAVQPVAQHGDERGEFIPYLRVFADARPAGGGPTGTAVREHRTVVWNDFHASDAAGPWRELLERTGIRSAAAFPIRVGDEVSGALVLYSTEAAIFREREVLLLEEAASDVSFALSALESDARRREAEAALREREARLASVFRAMPVGLCVVVGRVFTEVNKAMSDITGYAPEELLGQSTRRLYATAESYEQVGHDVYAEIAARGIGTGEARWLRQDGRPIDIMLSAAAIVPGDPAAGVTFAVIDVTEKRRLELQLRQAQKMEAVGELAGGVAHDFNNILTASLLQLELVQRTPGLEASVAEALRDLESHSRRAAALTRQLLLFSRRQVMQIRPLDLNELLDDMLRMVRRLLGENIAIEFESHPGLPRIAGDAGMIEQVVMNLCVNARDAMPQGGRLRIGVGAVVVGDEAPHRHAHARAGRFLRLSVADSGCGMDEATLGRIFEPFFTTKEVGKGTGLGLATVFGIVQQHRGWIEVDSAVGAGTTFAVFLPVAPVAAAPESAPAAPPAVRRGHETILLVEDEASVRRLMAMYLRREGYQVVEASDGPDALRQWPHMPTRVRLLISDMVMPGGLSGLELARRLTTEGNGLKTIIISGYSAEMLRTKEHDLAFTFVQKPCDPAELTRTVRAVLDEPN